MHPVLHTPLGELPSYTVFVALGVFAAAGVTWGLHRSRGFTFDLTAGMAILAVALGLIGARAWFVATHPGLYAAWFRAFPTAGMDHATGAAAAAATAVLLAVYAHPALRSLGYASAAVGTAACAIAFLLAARVGALHGLAPADPFDPRDGGLAIFGGLALATPACLALAARHGLPPAFAADAAAPGLLAACSLGRIGCFLNGCCAGRPSDSPFAPGGRLPTQIIESAVTASAAAGLALAARTPGSGRTAATAALAYASVRFSLEFFRDDVRPYVAFFTPSQLAALLLAAVAAGSMLRGRAARSCP